jgi:hypothetical protein
MGAFPSPTTAKLLAMLAIKSAKSAHGPDAVGAGNFSLQQQKATLNA